MLTYDPKAWFHVLCSVRGTAIVPVAQRLVPLGLLTIGVYVADQLAHRFWNLGLPVINPLAHQIMGVTLSLLIVFRTNTAYERFWEGRKLWGSILNNARNLVRGATVYGGPCPDLGDLVTAYALALKQHLRGSTDLSSLVEYISEPDCERLAGFANPPSVLAHELSAWVHRQRQAGRLEFMQADRLESYVAALVNDQGGCERILRTPIPFTYAAHIKQMMLLYLISLPLVLVPNMDWTAIPTFFVIAFGLLGIEEAGVEIEDPFGTDLNDLPLDTICATIARDARALAKLPG